jgi:hypothetical protein
LDKDAWNWYEVTRYPEFCGFSWRDNLRGSFRDEFDKVVAMTAKEAKVEARKFVKRLHQDKESEYNSLKWWIENEFDQKFAQACAWLEKTTKRKLTHQNFTIWLTTFPRAPYFWEKGEMFFNIYWVNPIESFLHEALHFQFHHYWGENSESPVSELPDYDFHYLKESLTVIIDDDAKPLIGQADRGYPSHQEFRKVLHTEWKKHHDFDKLVAFGLKKLPEFVKKSA